MRSTYHMGLSVRGALRWPKSELRGWIYHDDGRLMTPDEARNALMEVLSQGIEMIPFSRECDAFDPRTGCPGHPRPEPKP